VGSSIDVLLVEDDPGDVALTREALKETRSGMKLSVVEDGEKALEYLRREGPYEACPRPDLILLDLNLPRKDGREVLREIKADAELRAIPVVVMTTSDADKDVLSCYGCGANCFVSKPGAFEEFVRVVKRIEDFWLLTARLPPHRRAEC